jgi:hypothetical protein
MSDPKTPEQVATELRDQVDQLNALLREAGAMKLTVEVESRQMEIDSLTFTTVTIKGVYLKVEPSPRPLPPLPQKHGHKRV